MDVLAAMDDGGHEEVIFYRHAPSGLRAIVAIHSTVLGPALGGTRWLAYPSEAEALVDVLRLSAAMTAKAAIAGLDLGGGKATVIGDPACKTDAHLRAYGEFIQRLAGRFVTTTDVGTTTAEVDRWADFTRYLVGTSPARGGSGDTSALTSVTVMHGMRAALQVAFGSDAFAGRRIVVVGVGKVGGKVAEAAARAGARVAVADVRTDAAAALAARIEGEVIDANTAYAAECDVLSHNALGGVLSPETIPHLRCRVVCGGANNQLLHDPEDAALLAARGIVYAPDYVINSGGLINAAVEREGYDAARARRLANGVYDTTLAILTAAQQDGISTAEAAARRVRARLAAARRQD